MTASCRAGQHPATAEDAKRRAKEKSDLRRAVLGADIPDSARVLWLYLLDRQGKKENAWPSEVRIGKDLSWTLRKVQRWVSWCRNSLIFRVDTRGRGYRNNYYVRIPKDVLGNDRRPRKAAPSVTAVSSESSATDGATARDQRHQRRQVAPSVTYDQRHQRRQVAPSVTYDQRHQRRQSSATNGAHNVFKNAVIEQNQERRDSSAAGGKTDGNGKAEGLILASAIELPTDLKALAEKTKVRVATGLGLQGDAYRQVQADLAAAIRRGLGQPSIRADAAAKAMEDAAADVGRFCQVDGITDPAAILTAWKRRLDGMPATAS